MLTWLSEPQFLSGLILVPFKVNGTEIEGVVDTGATSLILPRDIAARLGLKPSGQQRIRTSAGIVQMPWIEKLEIEILGRKMISDAVVKADGPVLIGQRQLEGLDLLILPKKGELRHNTLGAVPLAEQWFDSGCGAGPRVRWLPGGLIEIEGEGTPKRALPEAVKQWSSIIASTAQKYGLPPQLIAGFVSTESGGQQKAASFCCYGLMGLLPATASSQAGRSVSPNELLNDPALNVDLGSKLIASLMQKYAGNVVKVAAAYNAGSPRCGMGRNCTTPNRWNLISDCPKGISVDYPTRLISYSNAATGLPMVAASPLTVAKTSSLVPLLLVGAAVGGAWWLSRA